MWHVGAYMQGGERSERDSADSEGVEGRVDAQGRRDALQCGLWDFNLIKQFVTEYGTRQ